MMMLIVVMMAIMMANISLSRTARLQGNDEDGSCDNGDDVDDDGKHSNIRNRKLDHHVISVQDQHVITLMMVVMMM